MTNFGVFDNPHPIVTRKILRISTLRRAWQATRLWLVASRRTPVGRAVVWQTPSASSLGAWSKDSPRVSQIATTQVFFAPRDEIITCGVSEPELRQHERFQGAPRWLSRPAWGDWQFRVRRSSRAGLSRRHHRNARAEPIFSQRHGVLQRVGGLRDLQRSRRAGCFKHVRQLDMHVLCWFAEQVRHF